jgi:hypothetical protein
MTDGGPTSQRVDDPDDAGATPVPPPVDRSARYTAANMVRSLLPLVLLCLAVAGWAAFQQRVDVRVQTVDPSSTVQLAAARAGYPVPAPTGLPEDYLVTSARTDAGKAEDGDAVTLEIGYLTPGEEYAGFVVSDDPGAAAVVDVLRDARVEGELEIDGQMWQEVTTQREETALVRESEGVTVLVTGTAPDEELREIAESVEPYAP